MRATDLKVDTWTGKKILTSVLLGSNIRAPHENNEFLKKLQKASIYFRWLACSLLPEAYKHYSQQSDRKFPEATVLHHMYAVVEDNVLEAWCAAIREDTVQHLSLHFDGVRVHKDQSGDVQAYCKKHMDHIALVTGFAVTIKAKESFYFADLIRKYASSKENCDIDDLFKKPGNCIPTALGHLTGEFAELKRILNDADNPVNAYAGSRSCRTYQQVQTMTKHTLIPHVGFAADRCGNYLLHFEHNGNPHCVAASVSEDSDHVVIWDVDEKNHPEVQRLTAFSSSCS